MLKSIQISVHCILAITIILLLGLAACKNEKKSDDSNVNTLKESDEVFHADNDIAMTVRSLMDALSVGEPLDSAQYTFTGVLTDGSGRPIYADFQGAPGTWEVKVLSKNEAMLRNLNPGDLIPDALIQYLIDNTYLTDVNKVKDGEYFEKNNKRNNIPDMDKRTEVVCYEFNGCMITFETRPALTTGGIESPLMTISLHRI